MSKRTAIGYCRVSTAKQLRLSPEIQAEQMAEFCKHEGLDLRLPVFVEAKTGRKYREQLQAAVNAACECQGVLLVYDMTRLFRDTLFGLTLLDALKRRGGAMRSVADSQDTSDQTAFGKLMRTMMLGLGQYQSDQQGEKIAAQNRKTVRIKGYRTNGAQPFGWRIEKTLDASGRILDCTRVEVAAEQAALKLARKLRDKPPFQRSYAYVADQLNAQSIPSPSGNGWSADSVRRVLRQASAIRAK